MQHLIRTRPFQSDGFSDEKPWPSRVAQAIGTNTVVVTCFSILLAVAIWQLAVSVFAPSPDVLPGPNLVVRSLFDGLIRIPAAQGVMTQAGYIQPTVVTLEITALGFVIGSLLGVVLAAVMAASRAIDRLILPWITGFQSMPIIAFIPLFVIWFGYGLRSQGLVCTLIVIFPITVAGRSGFLSVPDDRRALARAFNASAWRRLRFIVLPSALPYVMTGLELGIVYSLLGAVAAQFLAGNEGLGALIVTYQSADNVAGVFSDLIILALLGLTMHRLMVAAKRKVVFWQES